MKPETVEKIVCEAARGKDVGEEEQGKKKDYVNVEGSGVEETRALKAVSVVATGRSRHRGGVTRRGPAANNGVLPAKVIVTASVKRGQLLDDTRALDRNLPPPRLTEALHPDQSKYRVNYPGARLRVGAPRPSHLSHTHGAGVAPIRREEPHSINFGSSSLSMGAYHPREPVIYYSAAHHPPPPLSGSSLVPPPRPNTQQPRPQRLHPRPQERPQSPVEQQPQNPQFRPSKLLPPTSRHSTTATTPALHPPPTTLLPTSVVRTAAPSVVETSLLKKHQQPSPRPPSAPTPSRRGLVDDAPSPALTALVTAADSSTASLTPLGTITKSGVRTKITHRASAGHESSPGQRRPHVTIPNRHPVAGYTRPDGSPYNFVAGDVYVPPGVLQRTKPRNTQKPIIRITTRRYVDQDLPVGPFQENHSTFVPQYVKESVAEMEFEAKTVTAPQVPMYHNPNWFLMPVQGWFVLSIILAALLIVLVVVCAIIYTSLRKQRKKMKKLLSTGLVLPGCVDPVNHEMCQCRSLAPLVRTHTLLSRASAVSRTSGRSLRPPSRHQGADNYNNASQPRTSGFLSLPTPALQDAEKDNNQDSIITTNTQLEIEDAPPPLAPKKTSLTGTNGGGGAGGAESKVGGRDSRLGNPECRTGRESRLGGHEARRTAYEGRSGGYDGRYGNAYSSRSGGQDSFHESSGRHHQRAKGSHNHDVQLTTIYPPPRRFEL